MKAGKFIWGLIDANELVNQVHALYGQEHLLDEPHGPRIHLFDDYINHRITELDKNTHYNTGRDVALAIRQYLPGKRRHIAAAISNHYDAIHEAKNTAPQQHVKDKLIGMYRRTHADDSQRIRSQDRRHFQ